ncbi:MAG: hypothetical protein MUC48_25300 [Leptolyngbya sp. Prado105]|jgi:hypothetical protein|nr:hypothetical protein [Leptolyngbya sp. Prado105]
MMKSILQKLVILTLTGLTLSAGTGLVQQSSFATHAASKLALTPKLPDLPQAIATKVRQAASKEFNVPLRDLQVVSFTQETWSDGCLGLGGAAELCSQALVEGWRVEVSSGARNWIYRTDKTANTIRLEALPTEVKLPKEVTQRLLQSVARQVRVPMRRLKVAEVKPATWNGCFGIYRPGQACTMIAISGWQAIVTNGDRAWVYHFDQDAKQIVQNSTASNARFVPTFIPEENKQVLDQTVVFQSVVSGDLAGKVTQFTLTQDGTVTKFQRSPTMRFRPVVVKRLTSQQVEQFQQLLQTQRFPNLDGLSYITNAALADYPTTTFQGMGVMSQYVDLEVKKLPRAFQTVIRAWEELIR